jgi:hypothetical protein
MATVTVGGAANLNGTTQVNGPNVDFQADSISFGASHVLTAEITDPATHSALSTTGNAILRGSVAPVFTGGVAPSIGDSWDLIDAATISGAFTPSAIPAGPGTALFLETAAGGTYGHVVRATVGNQLQLSVDVFTGAMSIKNLSTTTTEDIDGYGIIAGGNASVDPDSWSSFEAEGQTGWEEGNPTSQHLGELNLTGFRVIGAGQRVGLGTPFIAPEFGVAPDLTFEYSLVTGQIRVGQIDIANNTLVLQVDKATGQTAIKNDSPYDVSIDGYGIVSRDGNLAPTDWTPLADSDVNWEEGNPLATHLGELNLSSSLTVPAGSVVSIGNAYDETGSLTEDLVFEFSLGPTDPNSPDTVFTGVVEYGEVVVGPALEAGDANQDLQFNFDDIFQVLARGKYETGQPASWGEGDWNGAPGGSPGSPPTGDGLFDFDDIFASLVTGNYETGPYAAGAGASAVPEPATLPLVLLMLLVLSGRWMSFQHWVS